MEDDELVQEAPVSRYLHYFRIWRVVRPVTDS